LNFNFKGEYKGIVSVIGASEIDAKTEELTVEVGRLLAKNKYIVSCGGLTGVMEAVCKGAKQENGLTIGIIPHKNKSVANKYVDIAIPVPFSQARNIVVVLAGEVCVAIGGKAGTLTEMALAWIYEKPIVALANVEGWSAKLANQKLDDRRKDIIYEAKNPQEIIEKVNELFRTTNFHKLDLMDEF
jgi:uncharacterized protein (TIGR00725 family)